jgi:hypothetical protein
MGEDSSGVQHNDEEEFSSILEHDEFLAIQGGLPKGFRVGTSNLTFTPVAFL